MASKYAHLKGVVPEVPSERDEAIEKYKAEFSEKDDTIGKLAARINALKTRAGEIAGQAKICKAQIDAAEILMRERMASADTEMVRAEGYTWSETCVPYPICKDPEAIVKYFKEHGMEHRLQLSNTELATRLKEIVREEAENNDLIIEVTVDETTGKEKRVVKSHVEGVEVFLDTSLSRRKAGSTGGS